MFIYKNYILFLMKTFPLIIFLLLQAISPIVIQPIHALPYAQSSIAKQHIQSPTVRPYIFPPTHMPTPVHQSSEAKPVGDQVTIKRFYTHEPAPMGIADYGVSPSGSFIRETTQWLGAININSLSATSNASWAPNSVSFQLNVVLNYEYDGNTYALWVQDVADFNAQTDEIYIVDNIWNFTAPYANITGVSGNGVISTDQNNQTYYWYSPSNTPGSYVTLTLPATVYLLVNVTTNNQGQPMIYFWYNDGYGWVEYDIVTVTNVVGASNVYFLVDGYTYTPAGYYYDAELIMGGPGNGTSAYINYGSVYFQLFYWNGYNFQEVRNAYNFGSDTAETVSDAIVQGYYYISNGLLLAELAAGYGNLGSLWNQDGNTQLTVYTPVSSGYIYIYNESLPYSEGTEEAYEIPFINGKVTLTLYPMDYAILVYNHYGELVGEANIYGTAGQSVSTYTTQFSISLSENQITLYADETNTVGITINAYGNVTINVTSPPGVKTSFTQETVYVNGETTIDLDVSPTQTGIFTVIINASIFPGLYQTQELTLNVKEALFATTFEYSTVGQPLPQEPEITLTFPNGTTVTQEIYNGETVEVPPGTSYNLQQTISEGDIRWATPTLVSGVVNSNELTVSATYYEQYLVNFGYAITNGQWTLTSPTVTYYSFTSEESASLPAQVWVNYNSPYYYSPNVTVGNERIISTNYEGTVTSPGSINVYYTVQYYVTVKSQIPVYAIVNNTNVSLTSGWYNGNTVIQTENITYYPSSSERYVITSITPSTTVTVDSPITIQINTQKQFYVTLVSKIPVYAIVRGINETLKSGWYNPNTSISVENLTYYPEKDERYVIVGVQPSTTVTVDSPITIQINTQKQYYITVESKVPVKAIISGNMTYLNSSWINEGATIYIINSVNSTYPVTNEERYVITSISPQSFTVTSPVIVNVSTVKQFLVTINNVSSWHNQGSTVTLNANIPFYDTGEFIGTYNVSPNSVITVNSPITEKLVLFPNYVFYGTVIGIILVIAGVVVIFIRRK